MWWRIERVQHPIRCHGATGEARNPSFGVCARESGGRKVDVRLPKKREFKLPWRETGPPNHHDDKVDSDQ